MSLTRVYAIFLRQVFLIRSNPTRLATLFLWVIVDTIQWGYISQYLGSLGQSTFSFVTVILGAIILWEFVTRTQHGLMRGFLEDIWTQNFINYFASPLEIREYLAGLVITSSATSLVGLIVMLVLATTVFGLSFFTYGLMFFPFLVVLFLFGISLGIFGCALVLRLGPASEWLIWPVPALLSPFAGVFYPLATLPRWMQWFSSLLPPAYVFEGMRRIVAGGTVSGFTLASATGLAAVYILLACGYFVSVYHHAQRTGLIARYSAETLS